MFAFTDTWWFQTLGWVGSALVVLSLMDSKVVRFRWLNLAGSVVSTLWNLAAGIWPFVAMNGAIAIINIYWLIRLKREQRNPQVDIIEPAAPDPAREALA